MKFLFNFFLLIIITGCNFDPIFSLSKNRVTSNNILDKISDHYNSMDIDFDGFISKVNSGGIKIIETK